MSKIIFLSLLILFLTASGIFAFNLPDTGQTKCYRDISPYDEVPCTGTGQDGDYNINLMSFTDNGNDTVTDNNTGLIWQKRDYNGYYANWYKASGTYDATYNSSSQNICGNLVLGGQSDWRLPSKLELMSLVNYGVPNYGLKINTTYFPNAEPWDYWTATTFAGNPDEAWSVSFNNGGIDVSNKSEKNFIRCVRGTQLDFGNFTDNNNGTVTDNGNGLMWQQGEPDGMTWDQALTYCEGLSLGGRSDWRLPNFKELESITNDYSVYPAINTTYFPNVHGDVAILSIYWSSTTYFLTTDSAYVVDFYDGGFYGGGKWGNPYVRCVRGEQPVSFGYYCDSDSDTYISSTVSNTCTGSGCVPAVCKTTPGDDCNDNNANINPSAVEICGDDTDDDCDGNPDTSEISCIDVPTLTGENISITPVDPATGKAPADITFDNVTADGTTSLTTSGTGQTLPVGYMLGDPPVYYEITTTAVYSGNIQVCINYSGVAYYNEITLKLFHYESGIWSDVTSSLDAVNDKICGNVSSLSSFIILEPSCTTESTFVTGTCNDGIDNDCDDKTDADDPECIQVCLAANKTTYYRDADGDGYGNKLKKLKDCTQPASYVTNKTDCDDNDPNEHPDQVWYKDKDKDGYSDGISKISCKRPKRYKLLSELTSISGDCTDKNKAVNPGATEGPTGASTCKDKKDNDCDGTIDTLDSDCFQLVLK